MTDVFKNAFDLLSQRLAPLSHELTSSIVQDQRTQDAMYRARTEIDRGHLLYSEDELKLAEVLKLDGWQVDVMVLFKHRNEPISVVSPTAMYVVSCGEAAKAIEYSLSRPIDANFFDQEANVARTGVRSLEPNDWVFMSPNETTGIIADPEPETLVLRFLGPPEVPVMATFNEASGELDSLTMGGVLPTSQNFVVELARTLFAGSEFDPAWVDYPEAESLQALLYNGLKDGTIHVATRWKIAQALINKERDAVADFMVELKESDSPALGRKARRVLDEIGGVANAAV